MPVLVDFWRQQDNPDRTPEGEWISLCEIYGLPIESENIVIVREGYTLTYTPIFMEARIALEIAPVDVTATVVTP